MVKIRKTIGMCHNVGPSELNSELREELPSLHLNLRTDWEKYLVKKGG